MKNKLPFVIFVLLLASFLLVGHLERPALSAALVQAEEPVADAALQAFVADYEAFVRQQLEAEGVPGAAVAIIKDESLLLLRGYGVRSVSSMDSVDIHTVFRLASLSKGFTGILAGVLAEEGKLRWDEPVLDRLPGLRLHPEAQAERWQLRHLLSHTTGLPRHTYSNLLNGGMAFKDILARLPQVKPVNPFGTSHDYQNVIFSLAGNMMEQATGQAFPDLLQTRLFNPLGMGDASATYDAMTATVNVALPHKWGKNGFLPERLKPNYYEVIPAAGVNASIADMAQWLNLLLGNRPDIAPPHLLDQAFEPAVEMLLNDRVLKYWTSLESAHYAMGWRVLQLPGLRLIQHSGFVNGYRCEIAFSREEKIGIVVLANAPNAAVSHCIRAFFERYQLSV
jgi:beta-lactamase class C